VNGQAQEKPRHEGHKEHEGHEGINYQDQGPTRKRDKQGTFLVVFPPYTSRLAPPAFNLERSVRTILPHSAFRIPRSAFRIPYSAFKCGIVLLFFPIAISYMTTALVSKQFVARFGGEFKAVAERVGKSVSFVRLP
jgi:hypothetical protein